MQDGTDAPVTEVVTWEALGSIVGASVIAGLGVEAVKLFKTDLSPAAARRLAFVFGVVLVELAVFVLNRNALDWPPFVLGAIVGLQAGLAASKAYETIKYGISAVLSTSGAQGTAKATD